MANEGYRLLVKKNAAWPSSGTATYDTAVYDTIAKWGIALESIGNIPLKPKTFSQSWYDEDGDDDFIPATPHYEAVEVEMDLMAKASGASPNVFESIRDFLNYLATGVFSFYLEYCNMGRGSCVFIEADDNANYVKQDIGNNQYEQSVTFSIKIKVNAPNVNVTLSLT